jgi:hypothetical protein
MQTLYEAASHIAQEIERTRQHLAHLEQALEGLRPLITIDAATNALPYTKSQAVQTVSDVAILVDEDDGIVASKPARKAKVARKARAVGKSASAKPAKVAKVAKPARAVKANKANRAATAGAIPKTGAEIWLRALGRGKVTLDGVISNVISALSLDASARPVIRNRAGARLYSAVKNGSVKATTGKDGNKLYQAVR